MKFRTSFQVPRESKEDSGRPTTGTYFKMPTLRESRSKATLSNGATEGERDSNATLSNGATEDKEEVRSPPKSKAMQDFLQKTGASIRKTGTNLKAQGASLKAQSAKLERRIPRRKTKVVSAAGLGLH